MTEHLSREVCEKLKEAGLDQTIDPFDAFYDKSLDGEFRCWRRLPTHPAPKGKHVVLCPSTDRLMEAVVGEAVKIVPYRAVALTLVMDSVGGCEVVLYDQDGDIIRCGEDWAQTVASTPAAALAALWMKLKGVSHD